MSLFKCIVCSLLLGLAVNVWGQKTSAPDASEAFDKAAAQQLSNSGQLLIQGQTEQAMAIATQVIADYEKRYNEKDMRYFCARTRTETLFYLTGVAINNSTQDAAVVSPNWAYAHYLLAYALINQQKIAQAKQQLQIALELSPSNAQFLSELGHIYQAEKNWPQAIAIFQRAAEATEFSPDDIKNKELTRALRGQAYALVEMNKLDEAEALYLRCLKLDPQDRMAADELRYVRGQKARK